MAWESSRPTHVPKRVRDAALTRDGNQCTATQRDGTRCPETTQLEANEITRWYPGRIVTVNDVEILCHWHHARITHKQATSARGKTRTPSAFHPRQRHPGLS